jgi:hypothetical protein
MTEFSRTVSYMRPADVPVYRFQVWTLRAQEPPMDKKSNHPSRSTEPFLRPNLTAFASVPNAICAKNGASNGNSLL